MTHLMSNVQSLRMTSRARTTALVAVSALSVAVTAWLLEGVREGGDVARLDGPILSWLVAHRGPMATTVMTAVTTVGGEVVLSVLAAVAVLLLAVRRRRVEALLLAVALVGAETISVALKHAVARARPPADVVLGPVETTLSFPSLGVMSGVVVLDIWMQGQSRRRLAAPEPAAGPLGHR